MTDQTELHDHIANIEDQMKQFLAATQEMTAEFRASCISPAQVSIQTPASKKKDDKDPATEANDDMPTLEDDHVQIIVNKDKPDGVPNMDHNKRLLKLEERVK